MELAERIVIIGACIAAVSAAKAIRLLNNDIEIYIYGEERFLPYKRIRLTKDLLGGLDPDTLYIQKQSWYEENNIKVHIGTKAIAINVLDHSIRLSDGSNIIYSKLLLAVGARNNIPPIKGIDKEGVYTLRGLKDARDIMEKAGRVGKILIIGGGVLGLEMAWCLQQINKELVIAEALPRLMPKQLDECASEILQSIIRSYGIEMHLDTQVRELTGEAQVTGYVTNKGVEGSCDMVIHSTGIRPNTELLKDSGIKINKGIVVNEKMETSIKDIYAAGDIAEFENALYGLWNIASVQGEVAGSNMVGVENRYTVPATATILNAFNYSMFSIGAMVDEAADKIILENEPLVVNTLPVDSLAVKSYKKILLKDNEIIGAIFMGSNKEFPQIKRAIERKIEFQKQYQKEISVSEFLSDLQV